MTRQTAKDARVEELVGTFGKPPVPPPPAPSLACDSRGHLFVQDGKCEELDTNGVFVCEYGKPLIPGENHDPTGLTFDGKDNAFFFDRLTQNVYRLSPDEMRALIVERKHREGLCLGASLRCEPWQYEDENSDVHFGLVIRPQLIITARTFFRRFPGLTFRFDLEDGLGRKLSEPQTVDLLAAITKSDRPTVEVRVPIAARRFGLVIANIDFRWKDGVLGQDQVGFSRLPRYPEMATNEGGFIGTAYQLGLKCERGYPWPVWSSLQEKTGGEFIPNESLTSLYDQAQRLGIRLFFQLGPNTPPGEPAGFYENEDYEDYAHQMVRWYGKLPAWELVNEPSAAQAPEWYVEAYLMPAYRGIKRADPRVQVIGPTTCGWHRNCLEYLLKSGGGLYLDGDAAHIFTPGYTTAEEGGLETIAAEDRRAMRRYGLGEIPIWLTETQWRLRHNKMAEDIVRCYIYADGLGIPKEQIYYFMAHTTGFGPDWGLCGTLFPPLQGSGVRTMGMGLRVLGHLTNDKKLVKQENWLPWLRTYLYANEADHTVVIYSYDFRTNVTLGTDAPAVRLVDFYGNEERIEPEKGRFVVPVSGYPSYLVVPSKHRVWLWDAHEIGPNVALATMGTKASASEESHSVFGVDCPPEGAIDGRIHREWDNFLGWVNAEVEKSPDSLVLEFPSERVIRRVNIYSHSQNSGCPSIKDHELFYEKDGEWVSVGRQSKYEYLFAFTHELPDVKTRRLKLAVYDVMVWAANWTQVYEVQAFSPWGNDVGMDIEPSWTHHDVYVKDQERDITVRLKSYLPKACSGSVEILLPDGGAIIGDSRKAFRLDSDAAHDLTFRVKPQPAKEGAFRIAARLSPDDGGAFPEITGHRTVTAKNAAPLEWMPRIEVKDPPKDSRNFLVQENARNLWTRGALSNLAVRDDNRLELAWLKPPEDCVAPGASSTPASLFDGDPKTAWTVKSRFHDRYAGPVEREPQTGGAGDGAADLGRKEPAAGDDAGADKDDAIDEAVSQEVQTVEWSLAEEIPVAYLRTLFADGLKGKYELFLSREAGTADAWTKIASGSIEGPVLVTEVSRPTPARHVKVALSDLDAPKEGRWPGWRPLVEQVASSAQVAVASLGSERLVGQVETRLPDDLVCEYEIYGSVADQPPQDMRDPAWTRIRPLRRGTGVDRVILDTPVKARWLATRVLLTEPVGRMFRGGDFEFTGVDGFGRPLYPTLVPAGMDGACLHRDHPFSGQQCMRIPPGGMLIQKPMSGREILGGGISIGATDRAERYLLTFYARGAPTLWKFEMHSVAHTQNVIVGERQVHAPGSVAWQRHRILVDPIEGRTNLIHVEVSVDPAKSVAALGRDAFVDDVTLTPGYVVPPAEALALDQRVVSPAEFHGDGLWTSAPFEIGTRPKPITVRWDGVVPEQTSLDVHVRFGAARDGQDTEWGAWGSPVKRGEVVRLADARGPVAQVQARFAAATPSRSPSLRSVYLTYEGSTVPLGSLYRGGPTPKIMDLRENLKKYAAMRRESAWGQFEIGRLYGVLGDIEQAEIEYRAVMERYGDLPPWAATAAYELGELFRQAGELGRAGQAFRECIEKFGRLDNCLYPVLRSKASIEWIDRGPK